MEGSIGGFRRRWWCAIGVLLISIGLAVPVLAEEKPQYGGIMKVSLSGDPPSLDTQVQGGSTTERQFFSLPIKRPIST
jgi:uncharacterized protein involved in exopolysaccharide biosynthesis